MSSYLSFLLYAGIVVFVGLAIIILHIIFNPGKRREIDLETYECGVPLLDTARHPFNIKFYLVALAFVLFDIEFVFIVPWAILYKELSLYGLITMGIFIGILTFGLVYIWKKGALEWK
ncbi:MAG: NADH-quinone oxidoreductase subunit A [Planctomycetota bacterium]|nr:MAG: NADH-quinone oxidoreductase subunit A [Planctomycetota bacterium]